MRVMFPEEFELQLKTKSEKMRNQIVKEKERQGKDDEKLNLPMYIALGSEKGTTMRHRGYGEYYRDNGNWSLNSTFVDGEHVCDDDQDHLKHLHGLKLIPISKEQWSSSDQDRSRGE